MKLSKAIIATLQSKRFWVWQIAGALIYAIPAAIKYGTGNGNIPVLNFPGFWIDHLIPGNLVEKILVNAFFPGGAGAITGEILLSQYNGANIQGKTKYYARLGGALGETALWSAFQYAGYFLFIRGPSGSSESNLFESVFVFPINFVLAALSIFTPTIVYFVKHRIEKAQGKTQD